MNRPLGFYPKYLFKSVLNCFSNNFYRVKSSIWLHWERISKLWNSRIRAGSNLHLFSSNPLIFLLAIVVWCKQNLSRPHAPDLLIKNTKQLLLLLCFLPATILSLCLPSSAPCNSSLRFALSTSSPPSPSQATELLLHWTSPCSSSLTKHTLPSGLHSRMAGLGSRCCGLLPV